MADPKQVSNLPIDVSIRWANDQALLEQNQPLTKDAVIASAHAQTEVILPFKATELATLLGLTNLHPSWASFQKPPGFTQSRTRILKFQLLPLLGSDEHQDSLILRIQNARIEDQQDESEHQKNDKNKLLALLQMLQALNKDLIDITTRCKQYQKG